MNLLNKLPGHRRSQPGIERAIWRRLPMLLLAATAIPALCYLFASHFPSPAPGDTIEKHLSAVGIAAIATVITAWTALFTVAIGCVIVMLMKGPAYVADAYPLADSEEPGHSERPNDGSRPPLPPTGR